MSTTAQTVIDLAIERSGLNDASLVSPANLLKFVSLYERRMFALAARLNPSYFGKTSDTTTRSTYTASWDLAGTPGDIAAIISVSVAAIAGTVTGVSVGTTVNLVNSRFPNAGMAPRAYIQGRKLVPYLTELGAADANMVTRCTIQYAQMPILLADASTLLTLPDEWIELVITPTARMLALRDQRGEEAAMFQQEYKEAVRLFAQSVLIYDSGAARPLGAVPTLPLDVVLADLFGEG